METLKHMNRFLRTKEVSYEISIRFFTPTKHLKLHQFNVSSVSDVIPYEGLEHAGGIVETVCV